MSTSAGDQDGLIPLRLGVLAAGPPDDVRTWSGIPFSMTRALARRFESVTYLPAGSVSPTRARLQRTQRGAARLIGRRSLPQQSSRELVRRCRQISRNLDSTPVDAIIAITVDQFVAFLETDIPIIHHSDTTFDGLEDSYEQYTNLLPWSRRQGHDIARRAIARSVMSTYPSQWAAKSAIEMYGADPDTTHVVPYGANLDRPPSHEEAVESRSRDKCRLLFIGRDWVRKGGPIVFDAFRELRRRGIDAELTVVGTDPGVSHERLEVIPFLNKQIPEQLERYRELWRSSAFLFMPSRAETFGAIYCEAAAYGLPAIAADANGAGEAIDDGTSGRLLPLDATANDYSDVLESIWSDRDLYAAYVNGARRRFETDLNWEVWGDRTTRLITAALGVDVDGSREAISP